MTPNSPFRAEPLVSIVLPTRNGAADLRALLPALRAQNGADGLEIVAVDSGSSDDSVAVLEGFGARVFSIPQREFGHGKTRNFAVRQARGEFVVFLSQDALPVGRDWLRNLLGELQNPRVGATFARQLARQNATPLESYFHCALYPPRSRTFRLPAGREPSLQQLFFSNVCSAARRATCLRFPFDESVIMSEDQFFARDLLRAGLEIRYNARAAVVHSHAYGLKALWKRNFDSGYSLRELGAERLYRRGWFLSRFLAREAVWVARRNPLFLPYLPLYEATRVLAFATGSQAHRWPRAWNRKLSLHASFWTDQ